LLREVQRLSQEDGVNLAGIKRIIGLEQYVGDLQQRVAELEQALDDAYARIAQLEAMGSYPGRDYPGRDYPGRDLVRPDRPSTALVVWRPRRSADK
jgi:MerR family transcriptional regulator/heat shock protein HspR